MTDAAGSRRNVVLAARAVRAGAGSTRILLALARGLVAAGHRVHVVADRLDAAAVRDAGARPVLPLRYAPLQRLGRRFLGRERQLALRARAVRRLGAGLVIGDGELPRQDVVLVHNIVRREVEELGAAATPGHEAAAAAQERALRGNRYDLVVANSQLTRAEFARRFGAPAERIVVVHPGADPAQFSPGGRAALRGPTRRALGLGEDELVVAFVSSGHFLLRGIDVLAATLSQLGAVRRSGLRLLAVGSDRNTGLLQAELARRGAGAGLACAPRIAGVEAYYHAADLLFHPAHFETFGLVVAEAAACGCPVLTSRHVGAAELFAGAGAETIAPRPEAAAFAPLLARLLGDAAWRATVAESQARAAGARTWEAYSADVLGVLRGRGLL
jgi:UDP-glucose:(heptosyl)LPS alpha-1,3-glucosyltransferase